MAWDTLHRMSSCLLPKAIMLGTSCKSCRHGLVRKRNHLGHPEKVVVASSKNEVAWDILQKMSSCLLPFCKTCRHVFFHKQNRSGHPAKDVVMSSSENKIAWDILQMCSSWFLPKAKPQDVVMSSSVNDTTWDILRKMSSCHLPKTIPLGTPRRSCRHVVFRERHRLGHPAEVVVMSSSENETAWGMMQKMSSCLLPKATPLGE